jgi:hypothetical protein
MGDSIADLVIALFCGSRHRLAFFIWKIVYNFY